MFSPYMIYIYIICFQRTTCLTLPNLSFRKIPGLLGAHCWFGWPFRVATLHTTGALRRYRGSSNQVVGLWAIDLRSYCLYLASGDKGPGVGRDQLLIKALKKRKPQAIFCWWQEIVFQCFHICFLHIFFERERHVRCQAFFWLKCKTNS